MHDSRGHDREKKTKRKASVDAKMDHDRALIVAFTVYRHFFAAREKKKSFRIRKNERRNLNTVVEVLRH